MTSTPLQFTWQLCCYRQLYLTFPLEIYISSYSFPCFLPTAYKIFVCLFTTEFFQGKKLSLQYSRHNSLVFLVPSPSSFFKTSTVFLLPTHPPQVLRTNKITEMIASVCSQYLRMNEYSSISQALLYCINPKDWERNQIWASHSGSRKQYKQTNWNQSLFFQNSVGNRSPMERDLKHHWNRSLSKFFLSTP